MRVAEYRLLVFLVSPLILASCGGGGGSSPGAQPAPTNAGGVWEGSTFNTRFGFSSATVGVVTENNGEARFINDQGQQFILTGISGNDGSISASITAIAEAGSFFLDGSTSTTGTLSGTVIARTSIRGDWSLNSSESGTFTFNYNPTYERGSDLARTSGSWSDSFGTVYTVESNGGLFAQDISGCVYDGNVQIINSAYNAYRISMTVASCGPTNGNYSGLGVLGDDTGTDDAFFVQVDNGVWIIFDTLLKL